MRSGEAGRFREFSSPRSELSRQLLALGKASFPGKRVQWVSDPLGEFTGISSPLRVTSRYPEGCQVSWGVRYSQDTSSPRDFRLTEEVPNLSWGLVGGD